MTSVKKFGVLLVNLGTPDEASVPSIKRFLSQFLHDKRVVDLSRWIWCPLLHGIILPIRAPKVTKLYQQVWMEEGSPLLVYSKRQREALERMLDIPVELGMAYGNPSLPDGLERLRERGADSIVILPLYPQYSATTTAAVYDGIAKALASTRVVPEISYIRDYCQHPLYIKALANSVRQFWEENGQGDYLLCSYHGIPKRFADNGDIYPEHCEITTRLLGEELGLTEDQLGMTYQSRFGREEWLQPYTDKTLEKLPSQGVKRLDIMAPAFSVDCLETLEELAEECKTIYLEAGGESFQYIPCLNDNLDHIEMMADMIKLKIKN
ncbi:ferrochelatase [Vibrio sp. WJH972]